jgi:biopolymer transport protein ExbD
VKVPAAESSTESRSVMNQTVLNVKADGTIVWNRKAIEQRAPASFVQHSSLYTPTTRTYSAVTSEPTINRS